MATAESRLSDTAGRAESLRLLAYACAQLGDHDQALAHYAASLRLFRQLGDRMGEARVHWVVRVTAGG
jgi:hypothetical protein